jgi:hypothetical protein
MGMQDRPPDTFGLPEYYVTDFFTEIDGPNVRVICGVTRAGQTQWLFSKIIRADRLMLALRPIRHAAEEAHNAAQLLTFGDGERPREH